MKNIKLFLVSALVMIGGTMMGQVEKPKFEKEGELVKGTFYYEDGTIMQEGTYKNGKLHGKWVSYNQDGKKTALAEYTNGDKTGKWFFWTENELKEVDYNNNAIAAVSIYNSAGALVTRD